jgi:hypothetical protein
MQAAVVSQQSAKQASRMRLAGTLERCDGEPGVGLRTMPRKVTSAPFTEHRQGSAMAVASIPAQRR